MTNTNSIHVEDDFDAIRKIFAQRAAEQAAADKLNRDFNEIAAGVKNAISTQEQKEKMRKRQQRIKNAQQSMSKSLHKPLIPQYVIQDISKAIEFLKEHKKEAIATTLLTIALLTPTFKSAKINSQINDISQGISTTLTDRDLAEKKGLLQQLVLTGSPEKIVDLLNISPHNHTRLYILSLSLSNNDFEKVLKELGYSGINNYLNTLGYIPTESTPQYEKYRQEYDAKLKDILSELNKNPDLRQEYLAKYPELNFIYGNDFTYIIEEQTTLTTEQGRSLSWKVLF